MEERGFVRLIICKSRKEGCSTQIQGLSVHHCQTQEQSHSITVAHEAAATKELFQIGKRIVENCDKAIFPDLREKPKAGRIQWDNGSKAECYTQGGSEDTFRGLTPTFLHISELPSWETRRANTNAADVAQALFNAVPDVPGTVVIIESTSKGVGNLFHEMWLRAIKNEPGNLYTPMFFSWKDNEEYTATHPDKERWADICFAHDRMVEAHKAGDTDGFHQIGADLSYSQLQRERTIEFNLGPEQLLFWQQTLVNKCNNDQDRFDEEWPLSWQISFIASGRSVFDGRLIENRLTELEGYVPMREGSLRRGENGLEIHNDGGAWEFYELPQPGVQYVVSGDASAGGRSKTDDYACIQVYDRATKTQSAEYYAKTPPDQLAHQMALVGELYNDALLAPEVNGPGLVVVHYLKKHHPNRKIYRRFSEPGKVEGMETKRLGYCTNVKTRHYMFGLFEASVRNRELTIYSKRLLGEMLTLIRNPTNGRPEAAPGYHDDACISMCICIDIDKQQAAQGIRAQGPSDPGRMSPETFGFAHAFNPTVYTDDQTSDTHTWF